MARKNWISYRLRYSKVASVEGSAGCGAYFDSCPPLPAEDYNATKHQFFRILGGAARILDHPSSLQKLVI